MLLLGILGPTVYHLPFLESSLLGVFGSMVGAFPVAYIATFGPCSGNRTMVLTRYVTGWYPSKLIVVLTLVVLMGYSTVDAVVGGQILSAVSGKDNLTIIGAIIVIYVMTWLVTTSGYRAFHFYERYAWVPQLIVLSALAGVASRHFDLRRDPAGSFDKQVLTGNGISFFSLCLASQITYAESASQSPLPSPSSSAPGSALEYPTMPAGGRLTTSRKAL